MQVGRTSFGEEAQRIAQMLEKTHRQEDVWQLEGNELAGRI